MDLIGKCGGLSRPRTPQLTFVVDDKLFVARRGGNVARCALEISGVVDLEWGAEGDRLHFGDLRRYDGNKIVSLDDDTQSVAWSRPTGTSVVYISEDRLMKVDAFGDEPFDISLPTTTKSSTTLRVLTWQLPEPRMMETYGLWLATNVGEDPQLLAIGEDARRIFSLAFAHDGTTVYYAAEHDDRHDVHSLRLALRDSEGETRDAELATIDSAPTEIGDVVVSEFTDSNVGYSVGSCDGDRTTRVWNGNSITELGGELAGLSTVPVGWLPRGELLLLARDGGCEGEGTLYAWDPNETTRLVDGVSAAGARAILPPPPGPPGSEQEVVA